MSQDISSVKTSSRITATLTVHHQLAGEQPQMFPFAYSKLLHTDHEHYHRTMKATDDWTPLDFGWVPSQDVGFLIVHNLEGTKPDVIPTEEEKIELAQRTIELSYVGGLKRPWKIPSGMPFFAPVSDAANLRIRGSKPGVLYRITIIPR